MKPQPQPQPQPRPRPPRRLLAWVLLSLLMALLAAAGGVWWWAGQEGSLEWTLQRLARGQPLETEGVHGSLRSGWTLRRIAWERDRIRVEAHDVALQWRPLALLSREVRFDHVRARSLVVTDTREPSTEAAQAPAQLTLPWRVALDDIAVQQIEYRGRRPVAASGLTGRYAFDGRQHAAEVRSLTWADGRYRGELQVGATSPMPVDARVEGTVLAAVPGSAGRATLQFHATARGTLADLQADAQLQATPSTSPSSSTSQATATARITPWEPMPVPQAQARFRALDVGAFWPRLPRTALDGRVEIRPAGGAAWDVSADMANRDPGPWDGGRLPLASIRVEGQWKSGTALVRSLEARAGGGRITARGDWSGADAWQVDGVVQGVDPSALHGALAAVPLSGPVKLQGKARVIDFDVDLRGDPAAAARRPQRRSDPGAQWVQALGAMEVREAQARGSWSPERITVPRLRVVASDARLEGDGTWVFRDRAASGNLRLVAPGIDARAQGDIAEARGQGSMQAQADNVAAALQWIRRWPGLADLLAGWQPRGAVQARLGWRGGWADPAVQGEVRTARLDLQPPTPAGQAEAAPWVVRDAAATIDGRLRDARASLRGRAERGPRRFDLVLDGRAGRTATGGTPTWRGTVGALQVTARDTAVTAGAWQLDLRRPVGWTWRGGDVELAAGEAVLAAPAVPGVAAPAQAVLSWSPVRRRGGELQTSGRLAGLPMSWIELLGGPQLAGSALAGDMVFDATWNANLGRTVRVDATLARVRGDVTVLAESIDGAPARVASGVRDARLVLTSQGEQLTLALHWDSERAGTAQGRVTTRLVRSGEGWAWPADAPLSGRLQASLPRIGVWSLLAPPGWRLRGSLQADLAIGGTRTVPQFAGPLSADDLALRSVVDGIELRNGRLRAELAGQRLVVREFLLRGADEAGGGGGSLTAQGEGAWTSGGPQLRVQAEMTHLRASIRSDRELTVSGPLEARMGRDGMAITGRLAVDRARIAIPDETPPRLGQDVLVRNAPGLPETEAQRRLRPAPSTPGRTVTIAVDVDLGDDFRVRGRGVDTRLAGTVAVSGRSLTAPRLVGTIRTVGGEYDAYGQRLAIERGELRFTGPVDNPALDVLAIRPNLANQRVGVQITGRAQSPHVELYSEPALSEAETLSWLVLGRSSAGGGAETALLQRAASALLAGRRGTGSRGIAGRLGLDDLTVRPDTTSGAIVRVGKRFATNFYAAYERSLSGALGTLYIFYDVSERLTVRAEAGERAGLDLIFTFEFDRVR